MKRKVIKKASILGIIGNIILLIIKAIVGFVTLSQAMIADAFNSSGDILSSVMTYIGNYISSKEADDDHNLGHGKAEYIYSLLISIVIFIMSFFLIKGSIVSLFEHKTYKYSIWLIVVCVITIIIKFLLYLYTKMVAKKYHNILIRANSLDHRNDCIITSINLISCILKIGFLDAVVGILISLWISYTTFKIFKESYDVLMDKSMNQFSKEKVLKIIRNNPNVVKINHFNATPVGYQYQISFTIFVDGNLSTFDSHKIANDLEKEIDEKIEEVYLAVIHVNPI